MIRNKYLDDLGIKRERYGSNFIKSHKLQRFIERRKYGFDYKETVNMDVIFAEWLYSRLTILIEQTMDDLTFNTVDFGGKTYSIDQAIHRILKATKDYIWYNDMVWGYTEEPPEEEIEQIINEMKAATHLWAEIMAYCDRCVVSKRTLRHWEKDDKTYKRIGDKFVEVNKKESL